MLSSKQRAFLRGLANPMDAIIQIGKFGVTPELTESVNEALEAREMVKLSVLDNCALSAAEVAELVSARTRSEVVQIVGSKIVLYRASRKKTVTELPKVNQKAAKPKN